MKREDITKNTVFVVRQCTKDNKILCIYGVYYSEENAIKDLPREEEDLEFNELRWIWESRLRPIYYIIDEYTVH